MGYLTCKILTFIAGMQMRVWALIISADPTQEWGSVWLTILAKGKNILLLSRGNTSLLSASFSLTDWNPHLMPVLVLLLGPGFQKEPTSSIAS